MRDGCRESATSIARSGCAGAERAGEVPAGAARDHRDLDALALRDAVHDLVHGAVAADDDEQLCALVRCPPRELGQLPAAREKSASP